MRTLPFAIGFLLASGCSSGNPPPVFPEACTQAALKALPLLSEATKCQADAGPCVSRDERNAAIDDLAGCLKALP